jgi:hypothetical protein
MSTSVNHAAAVLAKLPISEWNDAIEKAVAIREERERERERGIIKIRKRLKGVCLISCPHQQVSFHFYSM